jgi:hypothetical protein
MSLYIEWLNRIKATADASWLTDHQRLAYDRIVEQWPSHQFVCLCGPAGCGKTFIAWILSKEHKYVHVTDLDEVPLGAKQVIVDGTEYTRMMRPEAHRRGINRIVVVARHPPYDPMPCARVELSDRDVRQFRHNLARHHILAAFLTEPVGTDLGRILREEAIKRGQKGVTS